MDIQIGPQLTAEEAGAKPTRMAPRRINGEEMMARFAPGTFDRIAEVLDKAAAETRTDFIRQAVERELKRRERAKKGSAHE